MGWKRREAKRKKSAAVVRAQQASRMSGSSSGKWWLTIVRRTTCCANPDCHGILRAGGEMVFRKVPQEALCVPCAARVGISYRPSAAWEQKRKRGAAEMRQKTSE